MKSNENADVAVLQANQLSNKIGCYLCQSKKIYNIQVADEDECDWKVSGLLNSFLKLFSNQRLEQTSDETTWGYMVK